MDGPPVCAPTRDYFEVTSLRIQNAGYGELPWPQAGRCVECFKDEIDMKCHKELVMTTAHDL